MHVKFANLAIDILIFKFVPAITGFFAFLGFGSDLLAFLWALFVAAGIKVILWFFEKEIKAFSFRLRARWDKFKNK
jgi:hypothetical protein